MSQTPDPRAEGLSTIDYCKLLPPQRHSALAQGLVLFLPRTGLTVVPFEAHANGWNVVVVDGHGSYPVGGYHLSVCDAEIATAIEVRLGDRVESRFVTNREEADALPDRESILTPGGKVFRKWEGYEREGVTMWTEFLHDPFPSMFLSEEHFPAKVLGTAGK